MNSVTPLISQIQTLIKEAQASFNRRFCMVECDEADSLLMISSLQQSSEEAFKIISDRVDEDNVTPAEKFKTLLGQEYPHIIYDGFCGIHPNGFAAISSTLKGGGVFILLMPSNLDLMADPSNRRYCIYPFKQEDISHYFKDRFLRFFNEAHWPSFDRYGNLIITAVDKADNEFKSSSRKSGSDNMSENGSIVYDRLQNIVHIEQAQLVEKLAADTLTKDRFCHVITADRGRGKSYSLALLAKRLYDNVDDSVFSQKSSQPIKFIFCAHKKAALSTTRKALEQAGIDALFEFYAPDKLLETRPKADLLIIDEAASIPTVLLRKMTALYSKIIMATTTNNYEGSANGFLLKFIPELRNNTDCVNHYKLTKPYRWASGDSFELWVNQVFCLDHFTPIQANYDPSLSITYRSITQSQLIHDEVLLQQLFGLLKFAHYRTSPDDLKTLLDGPNISLKALFQNDQLLAIAMLADEGQIDTTLLDPIVQGYRRVRGHLIPQSLSQHLGIRHAPSLRYKRIMRIAVIPSEQDKGLGSYLLAAIEKEISEDSVDLLCASFSAQVDVVNFWTHNKFQTIRLGLNHETSTGLATVMMAKSLSNKGAQLINQAQQRLHLQSRTMSNYYNSLFGESLYQHIINGMDDYKNDSLKGLDQRVSFDWVKNDVDLFVNHHREYLSCYHSLYDFMIQTSQNKVLQNNDIAFIDDAIFNVDLETHAIKAHLAKLKKIIKRISSAL